MASISPESLQYQLAHINDDRTPALRALYILGIVLATVSVTLRVLSRTLSRVGLKADDWTIIIALVRYSGRQSGRCDRPILLVYFYQDLRGAVLVLRTFSSHVARRSYTLRSTDCQKMPTNPIIVFTFALGHHVVAVGADGVTQWLKVRTNPLVGPSAGWLTSRGTSLSCSTSTQYSTTSSSS